MRKREPAAEGRNGKRKIRLLTAVLLAAVMVVAMVQLSGAKALDMDQKCSLTVNPFGEREDGYGSDLSADRVRINIYKVAKAVKEDGYDTYKYELIPEFASEGEAADGSLDKELSTENLREEKNSDFWRGLAENAAKIVSDEKITPVATVTGGDTASNLECGLYLVMVDGSNSSGYATVYGGSYHYTFSPTLVSLPGKKGNNTSADSGDWLYDLTVNLKSSRATNSSGLGTIEIVKTLRRSDQTKPVKAGSFTFHVLVESTTGETLYDDNVEIVFTDGDSETKTVPVTDADGSTLQFPQGSRVTVTETYSGASYTVVGDGTETGTIPSDTALRLSFTNVEDGDNGGGSVVNTFTYSSTDGWQWHADPPQAAQ